MTRIVEGLKTTKATGDEQIPTEVWNKSIVVLASLIARICNMSLSVGVFPDVFKQAIIHPVFKGNGKDPPVIQDPIDLFLSYLH